MRIPNIITAGDSPSWTDNAFQRGDGSNVSAAGGWALSYVFRGPIPAANLTLAGTPQGSGWLFSLSSAQSAAFNPTPAKSVWYWQAVATLASDKATAGDGTLTVKAGVATLDPAAAYDGRSPAEIVLANIEKEIAARVNGGASVEYTIGTRSLKKEPLTALMTLRSQYRTIVQRERRAQGLANGMGNPGRIGVRFK